jgi:outer membrane protein
MRRSSLYVSLSIIFLLAFLPTGASGFEASVGFWRQDPSGDVAYKPVSDSDELDLNQDLNYDRKDKPFGRVKIGLPVFLPNIYLIMTPVKFEGDGSLTRQFKFGNFEFAANEPFHSEVRLDQYDAAFYYSIPFLNTATVGKLKADIGLDVKIVDFESSVSGEEAVTGTAISESQSFTAPFPMIYAAIQLKPVKAFSIEGEGRGMAYNSNHCYDLIGRIKVKPIGPVFIGGGYRYEDVKIDYDDVKASMKFQGPFVEGGVEF